MSKYEYKKMYLAIYLCLIAVGAFSMMARWINNINPELKTVGTEVCMVPNEKFFKTRAERLSTYFEKIASRNDLYSNKIVL